MGIYVIYGPKRKWLINHLLSFEPSFQYGSKLKNGQYGNCFLRYRISKFFKTVGHYHWDYQITLHWSQKHEQKRLYMAHLHPYATHGAGIWNPTFALVQNHSQSFFLIYQHHGKRIWDTGLFLDDLFCLRHCRR